MPKNYIPTVTRSMLAELSTRCVAADGMREVLQVLEAFNTELPDHRNRGTWGYYCTRYIDAIKTDRLGFNIFQQNGNSKLPFASFSALPGETCPGAGGCLEWCYSFRAWRYPAAFFRQLQNTLLLLHSPGVVADAFLSLPDAIDVRLYVDGDFESSERVRYWMGLIDHRSDLRVYGYSKSWGALLEFDRNGGTWPTNYALNLSSGSKYADLPGWTTAMESLPITRGHFVAVEIDDVGLPKGFARYDSPEYHKRVRVALANQFGKRSEVVDLAANLLAPLAGVVGREGGNHRTACQVWRA